VRVPASTCDVRGVATVGGSGYCDDKTNDSIAVVSESCSVADVVRRKADTADGGLRLVVWYADKPEL